MPSQQSLQRKAAVYLFCLAMALHLFYLMQYARTPFFWQPELDALFHDQLAMDIARGHDVAGAYFRPPLYPWFLGAIYRVFGHSYYAVRFIQAAIGSASCVLLYRLSLRFTSPATALAAGIAMAFYGPLIFADGELHTPVLEVFLDLAFLNTACEARRQSRSRDHTNDCSLPLAKGGPGRGICSLPLARGGPGRGICLWCAAGLLVGLSALIRPNILVVLPLGIAWAGWNLRPVRSWAAAAAAFALAALILPSLVTLRNYSVAKDPVFISSMGGINLYLGNRAGADGFTPSTPLRFHYDGDYQDSVALYGRLGAEQAVGHPLSASDEQRFWLSQSIGWWRQHPADALSLTWKKWTLAWTHREIRNNLAYDFVRRECAPFLWLCPIGFWLAGPLGLLGMALAWRRLPAARPLAVFTILYVLSFVPFFAADRYRLPVVPLLLLFGGCAIEHCSALFLSGRRRMLAPALAGLVLAAAWVNIDWYRTVTPATWAEDYRSEGIRYEALGRPVEAIRAFRKGLALDPKNGEIWSGIGEAQYESGDFSDATGSFQSAGALGADPSRTDFNTALCEIRLNDPARARLALLDALRIDPSYERAREQLAEIDRT